MLQYLRENTRSFGVSIIIGLMVLSMALFGVDALFAPENTQGIAAKVNGQVVSSYEVDNEVRRQRAQWQQRMGDESAEFLSDEVLRPAALKQLIDREVARQSAVESGVAFSVTDADRLIIQNEAFHIDGKFDKDRYRIALQAAQMTPQMYRQLILDDLALRAYAQGMATSYIDDASEYAAIAKLVNQQRTFEYKSFNWADYLPAATATDEEVQGYYDANSAQFMSNEAVDIEYILIDRAYVNDQVSISEELIVQRYQDFVDSLEKSTEKRVSHILIEDNDAARIAEVEVSLASEDFAAVASRLSDDFGSAEQGGDLGFTDGTLFSPEFEEAVASLGQGETSKAVKTDFGTHFITVTEISQAAIPSLESKREEILAELQEEESEADFVSLLTDVEDAVYQASDLSVAAEQIGLDSARVTNLTRSGAAYPLDQRSVINEAFNEDLIAEGTASPIIELENGSAVVVRIVEYKPSVLKAFDQVSDEVRNLVIAQKAKEAALSDAQQSITSWSTDSATEVTAAKRFSNEAPRPVMSTVFEMKPSEGALVAIQLPDGNAVAVKLVEVVSAQPTDEEIAQLREALSNASGSSEFEASQAWRQSQAEIERF